MSSCSLRSCRRIFPTLCVLSALSITVLAALVVMLLMTSPGNLQISSSSQRIPTTLSSLASPRCPRDEVIALPHLEMDETWMSIQKIFFTETSDRNTLNNKETCAVESAVLRNPAMPSIVVLLSPELSLASNATCQIYDAFAENRVFFRTVDPERVLRGSPVEGMNQRLWGTKHWAPHMSDVLRVSLVHRFGGWFSDLDMVFLRPLSDLPRNSISSGQNKIHDVMRKGYDGSIGRLVNGAIFHFDRGHPYLLETMKAINQTFNPGDYISVGPTALTSALKTVCNTTKEEDRKKVPFSARNNPPERCQGVHVLPQYVFYPSGGQQVLVFYGMLRTSSSWDSLFARSFTVHLYSSHKAGLGFPMPEHFGTNLPAYLYLAQQHCPLSLRSSALF